MKRLLVVVDMQNDFIDGSLGTKEAEAIVPNVVDKIEKWDGDIITTQDTHFDNYLNTREGKYLPVQHCISGTNGHKINEKVNEAVLSSGHHIMNVSKLSFGSKGLPHFIFNEIFKNGTEYGYIEIIGLCTDICVVSNALLLKTHYPEVDIAVDASCCAGVTPESHKAALLTMKMCQIDIIGE